jgi:hypothetical protein
LGLRAPQRVGMVVVRFVFRGNVMSDAATAIVRIEGEPFLSRAVAYFDELVSARAAWAAFGRKVGAARVSDPLGVLFFDGPAPRGWIAKTRNGSSRPKRGAAAEAEMAALPKQPSSFAVFGDALVYDLSYDAPNGDWGSGGVGYFVWGPSIGRVDGVHVARIPHVGRAAAAHLARHPDHTVRNGVDVWTLPAGLVEISEAEVKFLYARAELEREKAAQAA